ncbi:MAG: isocitrate dehydrogenase [Crocosphaera sp.]
MLKPKYLRVLDVLEKGGRVKIGGYTLAMSENKKIGTIAHCSERGEVLMILDIGINNFITWCEELEEKDIPMLIPNFKAPR